MRKVYAAGLTLVLAAGLSACGEDEKPFSWATDQGKVSNAQEYLASVEKQWKEALADPDTSVELRQHRLGEKAGCFYDHDKSIKQLTGAILCGPVRRVDSADDELWDVMPFASFSDDGKVVLTEADDAEEEALEAKLGADRAQTGFNGFYASTAFPHLDLRNGKGTRRTAKDATERPELEAASLEQLAGARLPHAAEDLRTAPDSVADFAVDPRPLHWPSGGIAVDHVIPLEHVLIDDEGWFAAPEGHQLQQIVWNSAAGERSRLTYDEVALTLTDALGTRDAEPSPGRSDTAPVGTDLVVTSADKPASFEVTSLGRTWNMDPLSATLSDDPAQVAWRTTLTSPADADPDSSALSTGTTDVGGVKVVWKLRFDQHAALTSYLAANEDEKAPGWSPEGLTWLSFSLDLEMEFPGLRSCAFGCSTNVSYPTYEVAVEADGKPVTTAQWPPAGTHNGTGFQIRAAVPVDAKEFTVTPKVLLTNTSNKKKVTLTPPPFPITVK